MSGHREDGSTVPLVIVLTVVAISFIAVAAAATALHLERLRLLTVADGAALAAAEAFEIDDVEVRGDEVVPVLSGDLVAAAVGEYVADADTGALDGLTVVAAEAGDEQTATVTLAATWHPPIANALLPVAVPVEVTSSATARFR